MRFGGALLAGLVYAFCLYLLVWESWPQTNVWALAPWLWLLTERVIRRPEPLHGRRTGGCGRAAVLRRPPGVELPPAHRHGDLPGASAVRAAARPACAAPLLGFAIGVVGGAALAAVTLIPFLELLHHSSDVQIRKSFSGIALPKKYLARLRALRLLGPGHAHRDRGVRAGARALLRRAAAHACRRRGDRAADAACRSGWRCSPRSWLAVVLGVWPVPEIASHIPVIRSGNHLRVVFIMMLCLALLAGWGLDELTERAPAAQRDVVLGLAAALLVLPVLALAASGNLSRRPAGRRDQGLPQPLLADAAAQRGRHRDAQDRGADRLAGVHGAGAAAAGRAAALAAWGRPRSSRSPACS